ncbi:DNA glycosylase [Amniculicola lignicola CBS 123094]|uniref:Adenine DNA glycosylase n=1 Tax=Amniculicola lignicola CBS 123094 TaxID=1392246 RepID=A0A6A5WWR9_9PLEO|nr:DNA glycosylase [Amniculicola lignicola CBS 123094]
MTRRIPKTPKKPTKPENVNALGVTEPAEPDLTAIPPSRHHVDSYHWPLLLSKPATCDALLKWFEGIEEEREMPWRKKWIDLEAWEGDEEDGRKELATRAYEVWVSEIMLQQTRVSTVISYFNNWISKWPTVQDLAKANHDEVLSAWKGLGYYSRATRLHQGAQDVVKKRDKICPVPGTAQELKEVPGIGPYTAGAISSIAFGEAEPLLDGNVARVLSRQLGLYADVKEKKPVDFLWKVAGRLVQQVSGYPEIRRSAVPGQWNQALMELGSTICTPRPKCDECPIRNTCRAFAEGQMLVEKKRPSSVLDIEDACSLCEQLDTEDLATTSLGGEVEDEEVEKKAKPGKKRKLEIKETNKISHYFSGGSSKTRSNAPSENNENLEALSANSSKKRKSPSTSADPKSSALYCSLFPKKAVKKKAREEECNVCVIELRTSNGDSKWLIEQRPAKGLLASLWQFPQDTITMSEASASYRRTSAQRFLSALSLHDVESKDVEYKGETGSLTHIFSHLRLTMHVQWFRIPADTGAPFDATGAGPPKRKWVNTEAMDHETLSTGMRRCWELVKSQLSTPSSP